LENDVSMADEE